MDKKNKNLASKVTTATSITIQVHKHVNACKKNNTGHTFKLYSKRGNLSGHTHQDHQQSKAKETKSKIY